MSSVTSVEKVAKKVLAQGNPEVYNAVNSPEWYSEERVECFKAKWSEVNRLCKERRINFSATREMWEMELARTVAVFLCPWVTPAAVQRCLNVMRRTNFQASRRATIDLLRDKSTPLEKRLAVLEYRARLHMQECPSSGSEQMRSVPKMRVSDEEQTS